MRVAVFIDNSNVFHHLRKVKSQFHLRTCFYNPLILAEKLVGNRQLVYVGFYYVRPVMQLAKDDPQRLRKYQNSLEYYNKIAVLSLVSMKTGLLQYAYGRWREKDVDTQLCTDLVAMAALHMYDTAVIVSNDGDYRSAVVMVKNFGKRVEVAYFPNSLSMSLRQVCDQIREVRSSYFQNLFE
ncbi:MAG: NYN domain-containing protein [bacterium]